MILSAETLRQRMDAGNDAAENLGNLIEDGSWFIVKRNLRRGESKKDWISKVKECCKDIRNPREGKTVYIAGHITTHGRRIVLAIGCSNVWRHVFMDIYNRFALA